MNNQQQSKTLPAALVGITVLEIESPCTRYAGKMFADMGADVILIEPPEGCPTRREGPFIGDVEDPEGSLSFAYYHTSKRGAALDLLSPEGRDRFLALASRADLVLEGNKPGSLAKLGLDYVALHQRNSRLVVTSITPFGQTGPYAQFECEDLVALALGGFMCLTGYPDSPPMRAYGNQAYLAAGMYAAVASMLALVSAEDGEGGQHVDVSMQESVVMAMETAAQYFDLEGTVRKRIGATQRFAGSGVFPCKDGFVYMMAAGIGANKFWSYSLDWLSKEGVPGVERLYGEHWKEMEYVQGDEAKQIFSEVFGPWALQRTKAELYHQGQKHHVPLAPVNSPRDILASAQLAHRNYFVDVRHPLTETPIRMPGAPYRLSRTPWRISRPAPRLGQHNVELFAHAGAREEAAR